MKIYITKYTEIIKTVLVHVREGGCALSTQGWAGTLWQAPRARHGLRHHVWSCAIFREVVPLGPALG